MPENYMHHISQGVRLVVERRFVNRSFGLCLRVFVLEYLTCSWPLSMILFVLAYSQQVWFFETVASTHGTADENDFPGNGFDHNPQPMDESAGPTSISRTLQNNKTVLRLGGRTMPMFRSSLA